MSVYDWELMSIKDEINLMNRCGMRVPSFENLSRKVAKKKQKLHPIVVSSDKIEMTIAMPLYRGKDIAWASLESLVRQKGVKFNWELIVCEEIRAKYRPFGEERILEYLPRLKKIGCKRFEYIPLLHWIPLSRKWKKIALNSSSSSEIYMLYVADTFYQPHRLKETYNIFMGKKPDWIQSKKTFYYSIPLNKTVILDMDYYTFDHPCGVNVAFKTALARKLPNESKKRCVDLWLFRSLEKVKGGTLKVAYNDSKNWAHGVAIDGLNNLSNRNDKIRRCAMPYRRWRGNIDAYIGNDIMKRFRDCKQFIH